MRAALRLAPNDKLTITPRLVYQNVEMDGWNRIDDFNILANPYTTTRPAVRLGERQLFTQIDEPYTDEFLLGDLTFSYDFGGALLTSITSYTDRDVLVGAWAVAPEAGEWIHLAALAVRARIPIDTLLDQVAQFPTWTESYLQALERLDR